MPVELLLLSAGVQLRTGHEGVMALQQTQVVSWATKQIMNLLDLWVVSLFGSSVAVGVGSENSYPKKRETSPVIEVTHSDPLPPPMAISTRRGILVTVFWG